MKTNKKQSSPTPVSKKQLPVDPIVNSEPITAKAGVSIYHLKVVLEGTKPLVWRRLQVPGNANLGWLHAVLQVAMGWSNSHLHQFLFDDQVCSDPSSGLEDNDPSVLNESKVILSDAIPNQKDKMTYEYDFGDSWNHKIIVEKILSADPAASKVALCLDGARACPPDDCGGVPGYADMLEIIKSPKHPEYESTREWLGDEFNPETFDLEKINACLRKLKWPRSTESLLRKALMERDDCQE